MKSLAVKQRLYLLGMMAMVLVFGTWASGLEEQNTDELMRYAQIGDLGKITSFLKKGGDPNIRRKGDEATLLILSAAGGHVDVVRVLIAKGADVNLPNRNGWTPLMSAVAHGHSNVVKLFLEHGADPHAKHSYGWTALRLANQKGNKEIADLLRKHGAQK